jgi:hypothetical protein
MWVNPASAGGTNEQELFTRGIYGADGYYAGIGGGTGASRGKFFLTGSSGTVGYTSTANAAAGVWQHVVFVNVSGNSGGLNIYINGVSQSVTSYTGFPTSSTRTAYLATYDGAAGSFFGGSMDEVRASNTVRSADWVTAEYNNQSSPSTFYAVSNFVSLAGSTKGAGFVF